MEGVRKDRPGASSETLLCLCWISGLVTVLTWGRIQAVVEDVFFVNLLGLLY